MYVCMGVCMCVCMYAWMYACMLNMYSYMYACICVCGRTCTYVDTHMKECMNTRTSCMTKITNAWVIRAPIPDILHRSLHFLRFFVALNKTHEPNVKRIHQTPSVCTRTPFQGTTTTCILHILLRNCDTRELIAPPCTATRRTRTPTRRSMRPPPTSSLQLPSLHPPFANIIEATVWRWVPLGECKSKMKLIRLRSHIHCKHHAISRPSNWMQTQ